MTDKKTSTRPLSEAAVGDNTPQGDWLRAVVPPLRDLVRASRDDRLIERVSHEAGVRVPTHLVLALTRIGDFQPVRLSDLADQMGVGRTTLSRQVADLVTAGLVARTPDPADARAATLELTPHGDETLRRIWDAWGRLVAGLTDGWPAAEREALPRLLARLGAGLQALVDD
ncbi:MarR family winged helix-turn-helix transcriptional regulator [Yinghuangia seranimata]|uniref:MarR family winged helix-turn-helix transcriptional regulator n=1 Tax=Yinghuangia seranimata TaxID=408067 RepID=UPI00248AD5DD|nr:MarR family winged helix-turn-helix transcriptional regulator [Yinghuangia seranimata]MDI2127575.1 MarR family winged helix-turn-helix transcriptional regulator [Yinghuangia seranimata]